MDMTYFQSIINTTSSSFVLCRKFPKSIGVVSTFEKIDGGFTTNLSLSKKKIYRMKSMQQIIPLIASYQETFNGNILFDCIEPIYENTDIFSSLPSDIESGVLHFDVTHKSVDNNMSICEINPRLILRTDYDRQHEYEFKVDLFPFLTDKLKIFSILFFQGFMLCTVNQHNTRLICTILKPKNRLLGTCINNFENFKMLKNIYVLWPVFEFKRYKRIIDVYLKEDIVNNTSNHARVIKLFRSLDKNNCVINYVGKCVY